MDGLCIYTCKKGVTSDIKADGVAWKRSVYCELCAYFTGKSGER